MRLKPLPLPESDYCPVCHSKRTDKAAIEQHNERSAKHGERAYPKRKS